VNGAFVEFIANLSSEATLGKSFDSYEERRGLTFAQAEGLEPLPSQLRRDQISIGLRTKLWNDLLRLITYEDDGRGRNYRFSQPWRIIFRTIWVEYMHQMIDEWPNNPDTFIIRIKYIFEKGSYIALFGFIQALLRVEQCPIGLSILFDKSLKSESSAFRIINHDTLCPVGSSYEAEAIQSAIDATSKSNLKGAKTHLLEAASRATAGEFANSVRESIHAVECVARELAGQKSTLEQALAKLDSAGVIHGGMKKGFAALYGYASDEKGIRHALLDQGDAQVTEADALFMLGACASFVTYMITRARAAGLLTEA